MLVISRKRGERFFIGNDIVVTVTLIKGDAVRLGIEAPRGTVVDREEVREAKAKGKTGDS